MAVFYRYGHLALTTTWILVLLGMNVVKVHCQTNRVGVLVWVDYALWKTYRDMPDVRSNAEATDKIEYYFVHLFKTVNQHYDTLSDVNVDVVIQELRISRSAADSQWSEENRTPRTAPLKDLLDAPAAINSLSDLLEDNPSAYSQFDHVMGVTGYDAFKIGPDGTRNTAKSGGAILGGACSSSDKVSVIEDNRDYMSAIIVSHELAHNLGAQHDGDGNSCPSSGTFLMAAVVETSLNSQPGQSSRPYTRFSFCSDDYIVNFINNLASNCLTDSPQSFLSTSETNRLLAMLPGQKKNLDAQCKIALGDDAFFCGNSENLGSLCDSLYCGRGLSCYRLPQSRTFEGTTCGDRKWCIDAQCVFDSSAPGLNEACPFGDYVLTQDCSRPDIRQLCNIENNRRLCCETCARLRDDTNSGCEYGDRLAECASRIDQSPHLCYTSTNDVTCCASCRRVATRYRHIPTVNNCAYGDRARPGLCNQGHCANSGSTCCATCYGTRGRTGGATVLKPLSNTLGLCVLVYLLII